VPATLEVDCSLPCVVQGDQDRLRQLLFNLLDNAIKYSPPGGMVSVRDESYRGSCQMIAMMLNTLGGK
jgi:signal transduction histidine kinase